MSREYDLRTLKTLSAIENSFMNLIEVKGFRNITINDIAPMSINGTSFSKHSF